VLLGLNALLALGFEQYPFLPPPTIRITATYPGARRWPCSSRWRRPRSREVNGVEGIIYMMSSNTSDGRMQLDVNFQVGTNQDIANVLTQNRVSSARPPPGNCAGGAARSGSAPSCLNALRRLERARSGQLTSRSEAAGHRVLCGLDEPFLKSVGLK
jgi:multidrug efflux pump subunit AcrB